LKKKTFLTEKKEPSQNNPAKKKRTLPKIPPAILAIYILVILKI